MAAWLYPTAFSAWHPGDDGPEDRAYQRVYASGQLTTAKETELFEEEIAAYHGRRHAIATNSGSSANEIAALALNYGSYKSAIIAVPAIAWSTTYAPFTRQDKTFFVMDVNETWNAAYLPPYAGAMVVCSVLGNPFYGNMITYAEINQIPVLEDNCESLGARTPEGRLTGTFGDISTGSGFYSHQLSAIELGWCLTDDDELARLMRLLSNHGNDGWGNPDFEQRYNFTLFGMNVRAAEINCAVAREQLKRLEETLEHRRTNLAYFTHAVEGLPVVPQRTVGTPAPFGLSFTVPDDKAARRRLATALQHAGIDVRLPTGGSFLKHEYARPWRDQSTPNADRIHDTGLFLGNAPYLIPHLIDLAVKVMKETL